MMIQSQPKRVGLIVLLFICPLLYYCITNNYQYLSIDKDHANDTHSIWDMSNTSSASNQYAIQLSPGGCLNQNLAKDNITLPNVLLIGVQKSGTTSLAMWLEQVGGVCMSEVQPGEPSFYKKEAHYFSHGHSVENHIYDLDHAKMYARRFAHCCAEQNTAFSDVLALDATPSTVLFPKRVRSTFDSVDPTGELAKRVKFIIILREPISRELSTYNHYAFNCREYLQYGPKYTDKHNRTYFRSCSAEVWNSEMKRMKKFSEFIDDVTLENAQFVPEPDPLAESPCREMNRGLYADFLREWFSIFDREQILVLSQEELVSDEGSFLNRVHSFLGLSSSIDNFSLHHTNSKDDGHKVEAILCSDEEKLDQVFDPLNEDLYRLLEEYPGPPMEQRPFQRFVKPNCTVEND
mmetsp:Transcript_36776/g.54966  ORF Transcript_36776/g.54966 Transcript_36776/m.54966 type:complete len:406 (-) Transcript_36776:144-1361(-)